MKGIVLVLFVVLAMAYFKVMPVEVVVTCDQVDTSLHNCISYLMTGGTPSPSCCGGVKDLVNITPTTVDRQAAYNCIKAAATKVSNINEDAATSLAKKCGVVLSVPISKNINCNNVKQGGSLWRKE